MRHFLPIALTATLAAAEPKPVPRMQAVPLPLDQVSLQRDGAELCRIHFANTQQRPFIFPILGPSGRYLTRMGHPHDPVGHSHHNSVWLSHEKAGGANFWTDRAGKDQLLGRIQHLRILRLYDSDTVAFVETENAWLLPDNTPALHDKRRIAARPLENGEWLLTLDIQLEARTADTILDQTAFGLLGVRMAKTIGVTDGGGTIRNSEGGVDEKDCFRKPARWMDYSGPVANGVIEGIALFDHPENPNHPVPFHCRDDGWMGASLTFPEPLTIKKDNHQRLRYALYIHSGQALSEKIEFHWKAFAAEPWTEFPSKK
jgi:hypothetical protein